MEQPNNTNNIDYMKDWLTFMIAVIACVAGVIFWVQSSNDPKFLKIESEINVLKEDIKGIRSNNNEILRIIGRLEGKLDN